jgi:hypothetical protein
MRNCMHHAVAVAEPGPCPLTLPPSPLTCSPTAQRAQPPATRAVLTLTLAPPTQAQRQYDTRHAHVSYCL